MFVRVEVAIRPQFEDPMASRLLDRIKVAFPEIRQKIRWARLLKVYRMEIGASRERVIPAINEIFRDDVFNWLLTGNLIPSAAGDHGGIQDLIEAAPYRSGRFWGIEKSFRAGVTDNVGRTTIEAFKIILGSELEEIKASSGECLFLEGPELTDGMLSDIATKVFCNELIESWTVIREEELKKNDRFHPEQIKWEIPKVNLKADTSVETYDLSGLESKDLKKLSQEKLWALNETELEAVRTHFASPKVKSNREKFGLGKPTDVEMECIAQTWSEHCKHKIFNATISYKEKGGATEGIPPKVESLFKTTIAGSTAKTLKPWLLSVFSDNAGIVAFDDDDAICVKVETHNSPSALDPYGGALTGIVGVNRDILGCGRGAKPLFNLDVFCVADPDYSQSLPDGILHPRRILGGVRKGVEDGGNQSGIPTINGALVFDDRFLGKPLVFCGTIGMMPRKSANYSCETKEIVKGDKVCMVGGRIGKDGIHGATFSSLPLDKNSPATAVQLGDPITQKRMTDFLIQARDEGLYRTITDNGAGGLSSSVGEMAEIAGGAKIELENAKLKYAGLKPYEIFISESQERMTVVVPPDQLESFLTLAKRRSVEVSVLGEFTDSGALEVTHQGKHVCYLELDFLHEGCPKLEIKANWNPNDRKINTVKSDFIEEGPKTLYSLLSRPNIASKEWLIRQYDHEVQGASVIKPLNRHSVKLGASKGPNDGGVIKPKADSWLGIATGIGICPRFSDVDPFLMGQYAVDEAIRNALSVGVEFGSEESVISLVDNFCWPDPVSDEQNAAALVRTCFGMKDAVLKLGVPLISGKDSMKNDYHGFRDGKPHKISVPPTLMMTAVGRVPDVRYSRSADFKREGDQIFILGSAKFGLEGSELYAMRLDAVRSKGGSDKEVTIPSLNSSVEPPRPSWSKAVPLYSWLGWNLGKKQHLLHSVHDVSDGGLLVAIAESQFAGNLGTKIVIPEDQDPWLFSFGEAFHTFVVTAGPEEVAGLCKEWEEAEIPYQQLGHVTSTNNLQVEHKEKIILDLPVERLRKSWISDRSWT